jgi:hypothetical protein
VITAMIRGKARRTQAALGAAAAGLALAGLAVAGAAPASAATAAPGAAQAASGDAQFLGVSCPTSTFCMAVGEFIGTDSIQRTFAEKWQNNQWTIIEPANPAGAKQSSLSAVSCPTATSCEAVGESSAVPGQAGQLIAESWNGSSWRLVPVAHPGSADLGSVSCGGPNSCVTTGFRSTTSGVFQAVTERWTGQQWLLVTPRQPLAFTEFEGVSCPAVRNCYAVGGASRTLAGASHPLIEHWAGGSTWTTLNVAKPSTTSAFLASVSCPSTSSCTATGSIGNSNVEPRPLVEDLAKGTWTEGLPTFGSAIMPGFLNISNVSCSAPRVCNALLDYIGPGETLDFATASRTATGGFNAHIPAQDVSTDSVGGISCRPVACVIVGGLGTTDGQGDQVGTGTPFAWRGLNGNFTAQTVPVPPGPPSAAAVPAASRASAGSVRPGLPWQTQR